MLKLKIQQTHLCRGSDASYILANSKEQKKNLIRFAAAAATVTNCWVTQARAAP